MKRLLSMLLALVIIVSCLSLAACNAPSEPTETEAPSETQAPTEKPTEAPTEAPTEKPTETDPPETDEDFEDMLIALLDEYGGKKLSVFGDSISTFEGISNGTNYNSTIGNNAVYYKGDNCGLTDSKNTYWGRFCERVGTSLCVNNAWSGDALRSGRFLTRAQNLHRDVGANKSSPDLIFVYFGINDVWAKDSTKAQPNGTLNELMKNRGDKTEEEVFEEWFAAILEKYEAGFFNSSDNRWASSWDELYALLIHLITTTYPDAKVVCVGLTVNKNNNYKDCTELVPLHNESMTHISKHFDTLYVDQYSVINETNMTKYMGDGGALHPNNAGHEVIFKEIVKTLYDDLNKE